MAQDSITVTVSAGSKVQHPTNRYENSDFSRTYSRTISLLPRPSDEDKLEDYEDLVDFIFTETAADLKSRVESDLQADIDEFVIDNGGTIEEDESDDNDERQ